VNILVNIVDTLLACYRACSCW